MRLRSKASGGMWLPPILWILCGKQKLTSSQLLMCSRTTPVVQRLQKTDIPCRMNTYYSMCWHWTDKYNKMSNHTPVVGFLQVSGQLTFGKNLPKRGLRASVTFNGEQKNISISYTATVSVWAPQTLVVACDRFASHSQSPWWSPPGQPASVWPLWSGTGSGAPRAAALWRCDGTSCACSWWRTSQRWPAWNNKWRRSQNLIGNKRKCCHFVIILF